MEVIFYNTNDNPRKIKKKLDKITSIVGTIKGDLDLKSPVLTLSTAITNATHARLEINKKHYFYFIKDWHNLNKNVWELTLELDLLTTYQTEILATTCYVTRSSNQNRDLDDDGFKVLKSKLYQTTVVQDDLFKEKEFDGCYVLVVAQNNYSG